MDSSVYQKWYPPVSVELIYNKYGIEIPIRSLTKNYLEVLTLQKWIEIKLYYVLENGNIQIIAIQSYIRKGKEW